MGEQVPAVEEVVTRLTADPVSLDVAKGSDGLPSVGGLYAWWTVPGSIPGVPSCAHPRQGLDLFYVGIAPKDSASQATLRSRVVGNHINGNTGSSTFRKTLASLLFETMGWQPRLTDRPLLTSSDNAALRDWQHENLRLTWALHPRPWEVEADVIAQLQPPLNLAGNTTHPFHGALSRARNRFKAAGKPERPEAASNGTGEATTSTGPLERTATGGGIKLHDEIADILRENGNGWMSTQRIADEVARRRRYIKRDGTSNVSAFQIHGRTKESGSYSHLFERRGSKVRLRKS